MIVTFEALDAMAYDLARKHGLQGVVSKLPVATLFKKFGIDVEMIFHEGPLFELTFDDINLELMCKIKYADL